MDERSPRTSAFGEAYAAETGLLPVLHHGHDVAWVDLSQSMVERRRRLNKGARSSLVWGERNLHLCEAISPNLFDDFRSLHARIAGRLTRSPKSWDLCFEQVRAGRGALILGYLGCGLVAGSLFIDGTQISVYWSGAYDRSIRKPLSYYGLWRGVGLAKSRGMRWLELGEVPAPGKATDKEVAIGAFKRKFATHVLPAGVNPLDAQPADGQPGRRESPVPVA
jgi:hypothetical protein